MVLFVILSWQVLAMECMGLLMSWIQKMELEALCSVEFIDFLECLDGREELSKGERERRWRRMAIHM